MSLALEEMIGPPQCADDVDCLELEQHLHDEIRWKLMNGAYCTRRRCNDGVFRIYVLPRPEDIRLFVKWRLKRDGRLRVHVFLPEEDVDNPPTFYADQIICEMPEVGRNY